MNGPASRLVGETVGRYRVERLLGSGGMGEVYLGVHLAIGNKVAIKILSPGAARAPGAAERFLNEARAAAVVDHENIARVIDYDTLPDGTAYLTMEYVDGQTLREMLTVQGALPLQRAASIALDVLGALGAVHSRGFVHRDLKPENVRLTPAGKAKVLDFGIAKALGAGPTPITREQGAPGTPLYMAPEQIASRAVDGRADLYSLGVILYECATGRPPFEGRSVAELLRQHLDAAPPWPHHLRPEMPSAFETVILRALEKDPVRRFASAEDMAADLKAATASEHAAAELGATMPSAPRAEYTPTVPEKTARPASAMQPRPASSAPRRSRAMFAVGAALGSVVAAALVLPLLLRDTPPAAPAPTAPPPSPISQPEKIAEAAAPTPTVAMAEPTARPVDRPTQPHGVILIQRNPTTEKRPFPDGFEPRRFDALGFVPRAAAIARELMSDAILVDFDVSGVLPDGHVDLTLSSEFEARYWFRSPSRSVLDPRVPENVEQEIRCLVHVEVRAAGLEAYATDSIHNCREKPVPRWRCSLPRLVRLAATLGAPSGNVAAKVSWTPPTWFFDYGDGPSFSVPDSCD